MNLLILQPCNPAHTTAIGPDGISLADHAVALLSRLPAANPGITLEIHQDARPITPPPSPSKYARHAAVRNYMLDTYLGAQHDYVLWIDSDLTDYPDDMPSRLLALGGIAAPFVELEGFPGRFYDIGGFIEHGRRFAIHPPYCQQDGPIVELDSVGCCYTFPAGLYRDGVRYAPPATDYYVEHWSVMQQAAARGIPIRALREIVITHAWLPSYGLGLN